MSAYYNSKKLKFELLFEVSEHQRLNTFLQGEYWRMGKGCLIGCLAPLERDRHIYLSNVYSIPESILSLGDSIFEGLSYKESINWPMELLSSIKEGQNLSQVWPRFAYWMLVDKVDGLIDLASDLELTKNIKIIAESILSGSKYNSAVIRAVEGVEAVWSGREAREAREAWAAWLAWSGDVGMAVDETRAVEAARAAWEGKAAEAAEAARISWVAWASEVRARQQADKLVELIKSEQ